MAAAFPHNTRNIRLIVTVFNGQARIARGFFERIEVCSLYVFNNCNFKRFAVAYLQGYNWHTMQTGLLRRSPSSLARHNFKGIARSCQWPNEYGLDNSALSDGVSEFG